jgi:N-acyl-phosphatidylethanolamine-hydrolysing phospholipase D
LDELPRVDIVVISHNHYDHLDLTTIKNLQKDHQPYFYVPLGNKAWFDSIGIKGEKVTECDW